MFFINLRAIILYILFRIQTGGIIIMDTQANVKSGPKPVAAVIKISVTQDLLQARLYIEPPKYEGSVATPEMFDKALSAAKVSYGIDKQLLEKLKSSRSIHGN